MLKNLTIRSRLIFMLSFMSVLMIGIGTLGLSGMSASNEGLRSVYQDRTVAAGQISYILERVMANMLLIRDTQLAGTRELAQENWAAMSRNIDAITRTWEAYMGTYLTPEEKKLAEEWASIRAHFVKEGLIVAMESMRAGRFDEAARVIEQVTVPAYQPVREGAAKLMQLQMDVAQQQYEEAVDLYELQNVLIWTAIALGVAIAGVIGFMLISAIIRQLNEAIRIANAIAKGDLTNEIEVTSNDEIGRMLAAMKAMSESLVELVVTVMGASASVAAGSAQIAAGNANLSQRTEEQASSLEETASSMEEFTSTVKQNADSAGQANQLALAARQQAEKGGSVVSSAVQAMDEINNASKRIADIIGVIDEIAFQTNLLALNAAVEAARAGEQGRGFAVVATEVRNLAGRSATAAKEIKELIQDSVEKVEDGSALVTQSGQTLEEIVGAVKKVTDIVAEIAAASEEQSAGIEQVNKAVMQLDDMTQQNAALVEEASAASEAMSEQAVELKKLMERFDVRQGTASRIARAAGSGTAAGSAGSRAAGAAAPGYQGPDRRGAGRPWSSKSDSGRASTPAVEAKPAMTGTDDAEWQEF